jgi:hypothetical protein
VEEANSATAGVLRLKPDFSAASLRHVGWDARDVEHLREGMRKAGLPE